MPDRDDLVVLRPQGLYCPAGDFYIDPWRKVDRAVITHAHADHARAGHGRYLATAISAGVLKARLGDIALQGLAYGETVEHNGVRISLHPAGHVLGSAQVRLEHAGRVWVAAGDYDLRADGQLPPSGRRTCAAFEPVRCDCFITESTFGLPIYRWPPEAEVFAQINAWWRDNAAQGVLSVLLAYSFGKAQRLLAGIDEDIGPILVHPAVDAIDRAYRDAGIRLPSTAVESGQGPDLPPGNALWIVPPMASQPAWDSDRLASRRAFASGWMQLRKRRRQAGIDRGFVLSDHADWPGLLAAIGASGCERVVVTHGYEHELCGWLGRQGLRADLLKTEFGDDAGS